MEVQALRKDIEKVLSKVLEDESQSIIGELISRNAHGHEVGRPIEDWLLEILNTYGLGTKSFLTHTFVENVLMIVRKRVTRNIEAFLERPWWSPLLVTKMQLRAFYRGEEVPRWQQAGADIVVFLGEDLATEFDKVILLNVKGHNIRRRSRPPNIMSGQRLLDFFKWILQRPSSYLERCNLWFVGINYSIEENKAKIEEVYLKDLFLLDLIYLPQINFDAAIQLQWHVEDMVEKRQTKLSFIEILTDKFMSEWKKHTSRKNEKYDELVSEIKKLIKVRI